MSTAFSLSKIWLFYEAYIGPLKKIFSSLDKSHSHNHNPPLPLPPPPLALAPPNHHLPPAPAPSTSTLSASPAHWFLTPSPLTSPSPRHIPHGGVPHERQEAKPPEVSTQWSEWQTLLAFCLSLTMMPLCLMLLVLPAWCCDRAPSWRRRRQRRRGRSPSCGRVSHVVAGLKGCFWFCLP